MLGEPRIVQRDAQPYMAIKAVVTMQDLGAVLPPLHPEGRRWLSERGAAPAGNPFFKYDVIDMDRQLEVEVGFPLAEALPGDGRVAAGALPAGDYATMVHIGHPSGLVDATGALLRWGDEQGVNWDVTATAEGDRWGCRLEIYGTDEPDMDKWQTELAFRLAG